MQKSKATMSPWPDNDAARSGRTGNQLSAVRHMERVSNLNVKRAGAAVFLCFESINKRPDWLVDSGSVWREVISHLGLVVVRVRYSVRSTRSLEADARRRKELAETHLVAFVQVSCITNLVYTLVAGSESWLLWHWHRCIRRWIDPNELWRRAWCWVVTGDRCTHTFKSKQCLSFK